MGDLTIKQRRAIEVLALGGTRAKAAEEAGVNPATIYNWLKAPAFREALGHSRDMVLAVGVSRLVGKIDLAIDILSKGAEGDREISGDQVRASNYLLNHGARYTELAHFGERLEYALREIEALKADRDGETGRVIPPGLEPIAAAAGDGEAE